MTVRAPVATHASRAHPPQANWGARELWSFDFFSATFGQEHVLCTDKARARARAPGLGCVTSSGVTARAPTQAPYRASDDPSAQTLRVELAVRTSALARVRFRQGT